MAVALLSGFVDRVKMLEVTPSMDEAKTLYMWFEKNADILKSHILDHYRIVDNTQYQRVDIQTYSPKRQASYPKSP